VLPYPVYIKQRYLTARLILIALSSSAIFSADNSLNKILEKYLSAVPEAIAYFEAQKAE